MSNRLNLDKIKKKNTFFSILNIQSGAGEGTWTPMDKPLDPKSSASANSATPAYLMVDPAGLEPATARLWAGCSNQLS